MFGRNIAFKLTFGVVLTVLVAMAIYAFFSIRSESRSLLTEVERHATQLSDAVKSDTEYDMLHNDRTRIQDSISRIGVQEVVSGPYRLQEEIDGRVVGVLGVIGPTRMPYEQVLAVVECTSSLVSNLVTH